jgi:hypothetical protein
MAIVLHVNRGLAASETGGQTSTVGEPSIASDDQQLLLTGNWYASRSTNGGVSWTFVDPFSFFPPANNGFCCDQTVLHDPTRGQSFWLLQYVKDAKGNTLRLAAGGLAANAWHWWDLRPAAVNSAWAGEWFDYNHAALSDNFLYVVTNSFSVKKNTWRRCVVFRFPLDQLASGEVPAFDYFASTTNGSLRCTQGAADTMYVASHNLGAGGRRQLRLWTWSEASATPTVRDIDVASFNEGTYSARCPDGTDWLPRCDSRLTGGWVANGVIGFMWTANRQDQRPFPFVRVVRIDEAAKTVIDYPDIWSGQFAYAYPDAAPNSDGVVGVTLFRGGGTQFPGHVVGARDDAAGTWTLVVAQNGTSGPNDAKWGDYVACRRQSPDARRWVASGYVLVGGGNRANVEPRVVVFESV